jgi:hypothetical protein
MRDAPGHCRCGAGPAAPSPCPKAAPQTPQRLGYSGARPPRRALRTSGASWPKRMTAASMPNVGRTARRHASGRPKPSAGAPTRRTQGRTGTASWTSSRTSRGPGQPSLPERRQGALHHGLTQPARFTRGSSGRGLRRPDGDRRCHPTGRCGPRPCATGASGTRNRCARATAG